MAIKKNFPYNSKEETLEKLLIDELTVEPHKLCKAQFFHLSSGLSEKRLKNLRERVAKHVEDIYRKAQDDQSLLEKLSSVNRFRGDFSLEKVYLSNMLDAWFDPWTRLAGQLDLELNSMAAYHGMKVEENDLIHLAAQYYNSPEYKPYLDNELKGYLCDRCVDYKLDYTKLPKALKNEQLEEYFCKAFPFLVDCLEQDLLILAYCMGSPRVIDIQEKPDFNNGFIGGKTSFQSYLELSSLDIPQGKLVGLGQINYKDCTNVYVLLKNNEKAISVEGLEPVVRKDILSHVWNHCVNEVSKREGEKFPNGLPSESFFDSDYQELFGNHERFKLFKVNPVISILSGKDYLLSDVKHPYLDIIQKKEAEMQEKISSRTLGDKKPGLIKRSPWLKK